MGVHAVRHRTLCSHALIVTRDMRVKTRWLATGTTIADQHNTSAQPAM